MPAFAGDNVHRNVHIDLQTILAPWRSKLNNPRNAEDRARMRTALATALCIWASTAASAAGQAIDTLVDVGGYRLHFHIVPGHGVPILFESGGGDDATVWKDLLPSVAAVTGTTLITYDRAGWGQSGFDTTQHGIVNGVRGLETALTKLGYTGDIMLVAHSLGGFYATVYASRHQRQVKSAVLIDANVVCFFTDDQLRRMRNTETAELAKFKAQNIARYYQAVDWYDMIDLLRATPFPTQIPVIDFVSERTSFAGTPDDERWATCHKGFVAAAPNRQGMTAYDNGHYIFLTSPELVTAAIATAYAGISDTGRRADVLARGLAYAFRAINEVRRKDQQYRHSEDDVNSWGYALLHDGETQQALTVFQLNVKLHPESANAYDSLAEADEAAGDRPHAIAHYKRALELRPNFPHAAEHLKALAPTGTN
jgi:pimeloyl-ACP methyl ester carboxylesterase